MDEFTVDAFVNRDDPIPVISFEPSEDLSDEAEQSPSGPERKRDRFKQHGKTLKENLKKAQGKATETGSSVQDRLIEKYVYDPSAPGSC
jgi:hypothetical protein